MQIRNYTSLEAIQKEADKIGVQLYETNCSYSFRVFENKYCTFLHIFYKHIDTVKMILNEYK